YQNLEETKEKIISRRQSEIERFKHYYHIDYSDLKNYDLVVDTTNKTPDQVCEKILTAFKQWCQKS
ncbi:MAG: hypothetical protein N2167_11945, partial [Flavobacteriales bacterium]|nr:hypothetical protein [Flavobacteriales bacterium]